MLTRLQIRNFKRFSDADVELGPVTVLCGPNNSGKTTALQALALWQAGARAWLAERGLDSKAQKRPGVQINRRDLVAIPVPATNLLWNRLKTREGLRVGGKSETRNIRIDVTVNGTDDNGSWECGLEFDYPGQEAIYCRPLRLSEEANPERMSFPEGAASVQVALLPAMSGLAATEPKWEPGRIEVLVGEGQTAQILRNLCYQIWQSESLWAELQGYMRRLFGVELMPPQNVVARGEITMSYRDGGIELDLSSAGRGQQQILLLLAYVLTHPGAALLLDEPDAHLEILRQRETYNLLSYVAATRGSQIIAASHSEVVLEEAAGKHTLVAFVGRPHRIDDRGAQLKKWLAEYPITDLYQAEQQGWIIYLEGSTDLAVLTAFAEKLQHPAREFLRRPYVTYVANDVNRVKRHFYALREAKGDMVGIALFDRIDTSLRDLGATALMWSQREIENYILRRDSLIAWSRNGESDLLAHGKADAMSQAILEVEQANRILGKDIWSSDIKASDEALDPIFRRFYELIKKPLLFRKADYHQLVEYIPIAEVSREILEKLDVIADVAAKAVPRLS